MTISLLPTRVEYTAIASQTVFNYTFKIFDSTDLNVYVTPAGSVANDSLHEVTGFSVTGVGLEDGGTITLVTAANAGDLVTIVGDIPASRTTDYQNNGDFRPDTVNDDFDRVVSLVKQSEEISNRSLQFQEAQQGVSATNLPNPVAGYFLKWNSTLDGMENVAIGSADVVLNIPINLLSDFTDLADALATIGFTNTELWIDVSETLSASAVVPDNINLRFINKFIFSDDSNNADLTINGKIIASPGQQIFDWGNGSGMVSFGSNSLRAVYPEWWGGIADGSTDSTAAMVASELSLPSGVDGGGTIELSGGVYMLTTWTPTRYNLTIRGAGHMSTYLRCSSTITTFIEILNVGRYHWSDFTIDGNSENADVALQFRAESANACAEHLFTNMRFIGAKVDTVVFADNGDASPDDISHITFVACNVRSSSPSNSQVRNSAANGLDIRFIGGNISTPGTASTYTVHMNGGQLTFFDSFFAGSSTAAVYVQQGQFQMYGGASEDEGLFFWSDTGDASTDVSARHILQGVQIRTVSGATVDGHVVTIRHEAPRTLMLTGCFLNQGVLYGASAGSSTAILIANGNAFAAGEYNKHSSGFGRMFVSKTADGLTAEATEGDMFVGDIDQRGNTYGPYVTFADGDTTPDVGSSNQFLTANTGTTGITNFDGGSDGQKITILFNDTNTFINTGAGNIKLSAAFTGTVDDTLTLITRSLVWYEVSRSVN